MTKMGQAIIEECISTTQEMLESEWDQIESMKSENDGRLKISVAYLVSYKGNEQSVKTSITFGRKVTESRESIINPDQLEMPGLNGQGTIEEGPEAQDIPVRKKMRRRTK